METKLQNVANEVPDNGTSGIKTCFEINGKYPSGAFSFKASNLDVSVNDDSEVDKTAAWNQLCQDKNALAQRHFEQSCAFDKTMLWLATAAIGLPIAYFGQRDSAVSNWTAYTLFVLSWVSLCASIVLNLYSTALGNKAFEFSIRLLEERYYAHCQDRDYTEPENPYSTSANIRAKLARYGLAFGCVFLLAFFSFDTANRMVEKEPQSAFANSRPEPPSTKNN